MIWLSSTLGGICLGIAITLLVALLMVLKKKGEGLMVGMVILQLYKGLCKGLCFSQPELAIYYSSFQVPFRRLWSLVQTPKEWFYDYLLMVELRFVVLSVCRKSLLVVSFASKLTKI